MDTVRNTLKRNWRLISFVLGMVAVFALLYALRSVILPFIIGLVLAYLLLPVIRWVESKLPRPGEWRQTKRISLIIIIFLLILGIVGITAFYMVSTVVEAFTMLFQYAPQYLAAGLVQLQELLEHLVEQLPSEVQSEVVDTLQEAGVTLGNNIKDAVITGVSTIPSAFGMILGFAVLPIFLFYLLKDSEKMSRSLYSAFSPWFAEHIKNIVQIIEMVLGRYIRAQLLLGLIVAYLTFVGLLFMRIPFYPALAVLAGVTELIPTLGPWIGGGIAVIITLAFAPDKAIWVALLFVIVQLLENSLLVPRIQGGYLKIHPAIAIVLLVVGAYLAGFWGLVLAVPLTATIIEIYKYLRRSALNPEEGKQILPPSSS